MCERWWVILGDKGWGLGPEGRVRGGLVMLLPTKPLSLPG